MGHIGVGWVMQGWGGVGHVVVGWVMQGWVRSCRSGVAHVGVGGSCRGGWVT